MIQKKIKKIDQSLFQKVIASAKEKFLLNNEFGVFGFAIGSKIKMGKNQGYKTLILFVENKKRIENILMPKLKFELFDVSYEIIPDIIATGKKPSANFSGNIPYNGIHPGSVIKIKRNSSVICGGVSSVLTDVHTDDLFLLTAGHLFQEDSKKTPVFAGIGSEEILCGELEINLLDSRNSQNTIDAALIKLNNYGNELLKNTYDQGPELSKIDTFVTGVTGNVQAFLPTSNDYSITTRVSYQDYNLVRFQAESRDRDYYVENALISDHLITQEGDSGTILFSLKYQKNALGICIGEFKRFSFFQPISQAINILKTEGYNLELYLN